MIRKFSSNAFSATIDRVAGFMPPLATLVHKPERNQVLLFRAASGDLSRDCSPNSAHPDGACLLCQAQIPSPTGSRWVVVFESMQTCGVHCDAMQNGVLEAAFRPRYSGFHPANGDEATAAIVQGTPRVCMLPLRRCGSRRFSPSYHPDSPLPRRARVRHRRLQTGARAQDQILSEMRR